VNLGFLASIIVFTTRYIEINAIAMINATKIVHEKEDRIRADFPHNRVYWFAKGFNEATLAGQLLTAATIAK